MDITTFIKGISSIVWLAVVGLLVLAVTRAARGRPLKSAGVMVGGLAVLAIVLTVLGFGLVFLQPEERGVIISPYADKGYRTEILDSGLHWIIPGERVQRYSISRQTYTMSIAPNEGNISGDDSVAARTADGQEIYVDASVIYSIEPTKIINVHIVWQGRFVDEFVRPQVRGIIRDAVSQYGVEEVVSSKRFELVGDITQALNSKLEENGLILVDFILRNITFSEEYAASVEQKQIAEQLALQAEFVVEQRFQEAEQARQVAQGQADAVVIAAQGAAQATILQAQAQAEAWRLIAVVLAQNPELLTYEYIQKIAPNLSVIYLPSDTPLLLPSPTP